jgi:hypothetical protein
MTPEQKLEAVLRYLQVRQDELDDAAKQRTPGSIAGSPSDFVRTARQSLIHEVLNEVKKLIGTV